VPAPDEDVDAAPRAVPLRPFSVVTEPGAVKVVHRSGRVVLTLTGATMREDGRALIDELCRVFDNERLLAREVLLVKPWWRFW
jgi:hypothetical protein